MIQNPLPRSRSQRLGARDDPIRTMHGTPPAGERDEIGVLLGVDGAWV